MHAVVQIVDTPVASVLEHIDTVRHRMRHHFAYDRTDVFGGGWQRPVGRRLYRRLCARIDGVVEISYLILIVLDDSASSNAMLGGIRERLR